MSQRDPEDTSSAVTARRKVIMAGAGLAALPIVAVSSSAFAKKAEAESAVAAVDSGPYPTRAYGARSSGGTMAPVAIERRALRPNDVLLDVMYCGVCHSDIHAINSDWGKTNYPCVPGHEAVGKVIAIGSAVTKFRVGDIGGVGCMVDSCGTCEQCLQDREQSCVNATTFTYDAPDKVSGGYTYGGYSDKMVVAEHFVIRIPPGMDLAAAAPLLCAGVTTFSPIRHWQVKPGQRVGVVGLGGLGHMAVKLAVAQHARVTVFTTSPGKLADANRLGAEDAVLWTEAAAMTKLTNQFDLIISTVPEAYDMQPFIQALKVDATMVNVGALGTLEGGISGMGLAFGRKSLAGSMIGGIAETQEVIDYCNARNIKADVEVIRPDQINLAFDRVTKKDVRYRFVIDMAASKI